MADLALFDFDGTITRADTFTAFLFYASSKRRLFVGRLLLLPVVLAFKARVLPSTVVRRCVAFVAYRGRLAREIEELGERFAANELPGLVRLEALARLSWHKARGDEVVVVSASLACYLKPWCRLQGVELLCARLQDKAGKLTGFYDGADCKGREKARRVRETFNLGSYGKIFAYGDTSEDAELLDLAHEAYFRWQPRVRAQNRSISFK